MGKRLRFVQPDMVRLALSDGDWIDVKKELTIGERRKVMASVVKEMRQDGRMTPDLEMIGKGQILAYLVDWSFTDAQDKRVPIDTDAKKLAAIDGLDEASYKEIEEAINAHDDAMKLAKNGQGGESQPSATSSSAE